MPHSVQTVTGVISNGATTLGPWDASQYETAVMGISGTYSGISIGLEGSIDGTFWYPINGVLQAGSAVTSGFTTPTANQANMYIFAIPAVSLVRIRSTAFVSGSMLVSLSLTSAPAPPINVNIGNSASVIPTPSASSGGVASNVHLVSAATTNATTVKGSAGMVGHIVMVNTSAAAKYVKLFNKATAPTVGTDTPTVTFQIPANQQVIFDPANYYRMTTGIGFAITNLPADLDATAVAAGDVILSINYL